ncbi:unnamed protein product, partial [Fusarium graminearum]
RENSIRQTSGVHHGCTRYRSLSGETRYFSLDRQPHEVWAARRGSDRHETVLVLLIRNPSHIPSVRLSSPNRGPFVRHRTNT